MTTAEKIQAARRTYADKYQLSAQESKDTCARLVHVSPSTWHKWEHGVQQMHPGLAELFTLKTGIKL